jgi:hypothetical protein
MAKKVPQRKAAPKQQTKTTAAKSTAVAKRGTDADRVEEVFKWILSGITEHELKKKIAEAWPNADDQPLILSAVKRFSQSGQLDPTAVMGFCFEASRDLYNRLVDAGDFAGALRAVKQMADLARKQQ